jgi:transcriptional regulator with XRE-family HTH domain
MGYESGPPNLPPAGTGPATDAAAQNRTRAVESAIDEFRETVQTDLPPDGPQARGETELRRVAERVRCWREEGQLTLQELARRSGVAASTIQKVETQQMTPTVGVLIKIAHGLDRATTELFREPTSELHVVHLPAAARHPVGLRSQMIVERLTGDVSEPSLEVWRVVHEPGSGSGSDAVRWDGEALAFCESGEVDYRIGDETYTLRAGDSLHYKTTLPHSWINNGTSPAHVLFVVTLPDKLKTLFHRRLREAAAAAATAKPFGDA